MVHIWVWRAFYLFNFAGNNKPINFFLHMLQFKVIREDIKLNNLPSSYVANIDHAYRRALHNGLLSAKDFTDIVYGLPSQTPEIFDSEQWTLLRSFFLFNCWLIISVRQNPIRTGLSFLCELCQKRSIWSILKIFIFYDFFLSD